VWPDISEKKDPGMLLKEELIDCLENAVYVKSDSLGSTNE
jgi:hypothetical protein